MPNRISSKTLSIANREKAANRKSAEVEPDRENRQIVKTDNVKNYLPNNDSITSKNNKVKQMKEFFDNLAKVDSNSVKNKIPIERSQVKERVALFENMSKAKETIAPRSKNIKDKTLESKTEEFNIQKPSLYNKNISNKQGKTQSRNPPTVGSRSDYADMSSQELQEVYESLINDIYNDDKHKNELNLYKSFISYLKPLELPDQIEILTVSRLISFKTTDNLKNLYSCFSFILNSCELNDNDIPSIETLNTIIKAADDLPQYGKEGVNFIYSFFHDLQIGNINPFTNSDIILFMLQLSKDKIKHILNSPDAEEQQLIISFIKKFDL